MKRQSEDVTINRQTLAHLTLAAAAWFESLKRQQHDATERDPEIEDMLLSLGASILVAKPLLALKDQQFLATVMKWVQ